MKNYYLLLCAFLCSFVAWQPAMAQTPTYYKDGGTTSSNTIPLGQASSKGQLLFAPADFNTLPPSGNIVKVYYRASAAGGGVTATYTNFKISFIQTTDPSFPSTSYYTGLTPALSEATYTITATQAGGWFEIPLTTPYLYDNTKSLVVEVQYSAVTNGSSAAGISTITSVSVGNKRCSGTSLTATTGTTNTTQNDWGMDVIPSTPCNASTTAGTATANTRVVCTGQSVVLNATGTTKAAGLTYQWQSSATELGTYNNVGASSPSFTNTTVTPASTTWYRLSVTCGASTVYSAPIQIIVQSALHPGGTFTINSASPTGGTNYNNFTDAVNAIKCGFSTSVIFNVVGTGTYNEQVTIPHIASSSSTNTITINGNGATLTSATTNDKRAVLKIDGTDYLTINNLKIIATGNTYGAAVHMTNDADNNTINNCTITGDVTSTSTFLAALAISGGASFTDVSNCDNITISNNTITGGFQGITMYGNGTTARVNNCKIINNTIKEFYAYGIDADGHNNILIEGNDISRPARTVIDDFYGVALANSLNSKISKNRLHNSMDGAPTSTSVSYPIYVAASDGTVGSENVVSNNLIYNMTGNGTIYALYNSGSDYTLYYYNTVSLDNTAATAGVTRGFYQATSATGIDVKNNIFSITRGGTGAKFLVYRGAAASTITFDNNAYYLNSAAGTNNFGYSGSAQATFANWKTTTSQDANSIEGNNPSFVDASIGNLAPTNTAIDNKGVAIAGITTDILGATRSTTTPDVGAIEFPVVSCVAPTGLAAASITATTANLSWTAVSGSVGYEYSVIASATPPATGTATTGTTYNAGVYTPGTVYYLHVRNKCGASSFSAWTTYSFTTLCPAPATPTITGITLNGATINWTAVTGATGYEYAVITSATPPASGTPTTATSHAPSTLNSATTYYVHLRTKCSGTVYSAWTTTSFTTLTCAAPATPTVTAITQSSATINWTAIGGAIGYEYSVIASATPPASGTPTTSTTYSPGTLNPSTTYYVHIRTQCNATTYSAWTTTSFTTSASTCTAPPTPVVTGITPTGATINWGAVGGAIGYEYAVIASATPPASGFSTTATTYSPSTLTQGTAYYVHVRTQCSASVYSAWTTTSFTTTYPPCAPTAGVNISGITFNGANITWTAVPGALDYEYVVSTSATPPATGTVTTATSFNPVTLASATKYYVYVRSHCAGSMYSAWVSNSFTTAVCTVPATAAITNITYTSADISWPAIPGSQGYEYVVDNNPAPPASGTPTTATTYNAVGLTGSTVYYVHVRSKCSAGNYSGWITTMFRTLTCGTVTPVVSNVGFTTVDITWASVPGAVGYEYVLTTVAAPPAVGSPTSSNSYNATNLTPNTTYYMHMRTRCETNSWSVWTTISFNTLGCDKPGAPSITSISYSSADFNWPSVPGVSGYEYAVTLNGYLPIITTTTGSTNAQVNNLSMATTYNIHVRSVCIGIYKSPWEVATFRTKEHPTNIANVNGEISLEAYPNPTHDQVTVKLNSISQASGKIQLTDMAGRILKTLNITSVETIVDMGQLANGIYMLQYIDASNSSKTIRITKN